MTYEQGSDLLLTALGGFHGRFKKMFGQAALRLDADSYIMTGANAQLSTITESSLIVCDINSGELGEIFRSCSNINALIVGCSQDTTAVSDRASDLEVTLEDLAHLTGSHLRIIPDASAASIVPVLKETSVCLIRGLGALAAASNPRKAVAGIQIIEKACEAETHGEVLGGTIPIPADIAEECRSEFISDYVNRNESKEVAYMGFDEAEFALRSQLIDCGRALVDKDLAYGSWGNLSVRLNDHEMLITPSSMDYFDIKPEDIVRVDINTLIYGDQRTPSGTAPLHAALYREFPDIGSVIHTHSNALSVFAACHAGFALTDPSMHQLIGDILVTKPAKSFTQELINVVTETMHNTHAAIIPNHGGIFTGPSPEVVLAIAEAVEIHARNLLGFAARTEEE